MNIAAEVLTTALEGGIGYWSLADNIVRDRDLNVLSVDLHEMVEMPHDGIEYLVQRTWLGEAYYQRVPHRVNVEMVLRVIKAIANGSEFKYVGSHLRALCVDLLHHPDDADYDSDDADMIVQIAAIGEVVYG